MVPANKLVVKTLKRLGPEGTNAVVNFFTAMKDYSGDMQMESSVYAWLDEVRDAERQAFSPE